MKKIFFCFILSQIVQNQNNILPNDLQLKTYSDIQYDVSGIKLYQGTTYNTADMNFQILQIDLAFNQVLIGDASKVGWGLNCNESINTCEIVKKILEQKIYMNSKFYADLSKSFFRFDNKDALNVNIENQKLNFDLINSTLKWPLGQYGVLGMNPQGDFLKYLKNIYQNQDISFRIQYQKNGQKLSQDIQYDLKFTINPQQYIKGTKYEYKILQNEKPNIQAVLQSNDQIIYKQYNFCLKGISNNIFNIKNSQQLCDQLKNKVCEDIDNCNKSNSNLDDSVDLIFSLDNFNLNFTKNDYFYYDNQNQLQCRIGEFNSSEDGCQADQDASIGKHFLSKYPLKIIYAQDNSTNYTFYRLQKQKKVPSIIFYLAIFASLLALFFLIYYGCFQKKTKENEEMYVEIKRSKTQEKL